MRRTDNVIRFTKEWIASLPKPCDREEWNDSHCDCLTLRVGRSGSKVFYFFGRINGDVTRMKLGEFPHLELADARNEVKRMLGEAARGVVPTPKATQAKREIRLGDLIDWYLRTHSKVHKETYPRDKRMFEVHFSSWRRRRLSTITKAEVKELFTTIGETRPSAANRMISVFGSMWRLGQDEFNVKSPDPTSRIKRFREKQRARFLTQDEMLRFFQALLNLRYQVSKDVIMVALFTGARRSNVCAMQWKHIDFDEQAWIVPADESKNRHELRIVLPRPAMMILERRREDAVTPWVFPGRGRDGHYTEPKEAMKNLLNDAKIDDFRFHDLRRTLGSWQAIEGFSLAVIGKTLGHQSTSATAVYARLTDKTVQASVNDVATKMESVREEASRKQAASARKSKPAERARPRKPK